MTTLKMLTLEAWAGSVYGDSQPALVTLRRWARESKIYPVPEKHGRAYFVREDARYIDPSKPVPPDLPPARGGGVRLIDRIPLNVPSS
jgi:hypothetical protein